MLNEPLIVEDTLLLLFQPDSGTIAGENILFYVLGGAVLADLSLGGRVEAEEHGHVTDPRRASGARRWRCSQPPHGGEHRPAGGKRHAPPVPRGDPMGYRCLHASQGAGAW